MRVRMLYDFRFSFNLAGFSLILQAALQQIPIFSPPVSPSPSEKRNEGLMFHWCTSTIKTYGPPLDQASSFAIPAIPQPSLDVLVTALTALPDTP
ncbi:hypothetical protein C8R48DRAFT_779898 [Suillus tomentosus]|nr:hypothetical protein C8R48DRAFT_779898 [Suillus tomentosus]